GSPLARPADDLRGTLQEALAGHFGRACVISRLTRRPSAYRTSYPIEDLDVCLDDGTALQLLVKDLSWEALPAPVRQAKPAFLYDPRREMEIYRTILAPLRLGTAICYGVTASGGGGEPTTRHGLFLEKVNGVELYQVGEFEIWRQAARWLAGLHARFAGRT